MALCNADVTATSARHNQFYQNSFDFKAFWTERKFHQKWKQNKLKTKRSASINSPRWKFWERIAENL